MDYEQLKQSILERKDILDWHKEIIKIMDDKDICDVMNSIDSLRNLFKLKFQEMGSTRSK